MAQIWDTLRNAPGQDSSVARSGTVDAALQSAAKVVKATHQTPFQMHGSIGLSCAIADVKQDRATFWSGTQMPHEARRVMAKLLNIPVERIELHWYGAPGAYGRYRLGQS
jgi:nicotinate dehydrogenase subunit B